MRTLSRRSRFDLFRNRRAQGARRKQRRLFLESLEPRQLMTVVVSIEGFGEEAEDASSSDGYFVISRDASSPDPLTVYFTVTGAAIEGADYQSIGNSAVIPANELSVTIELQAIEDNDTETPEPVVTTLDSHASYAVGSENSASVNIIHCMTYFEESTAVPPTCPTCPPGPSQAINAGSNGNWAPNRFPGIVAGDGVYQPELFTMSAMLARNNTAFHGENRNFGSPASFTQR